MSEAIAVLLKDGTKVQLGDGVRDEVTGAAGIVAGFAFYIWGPPRVLIAPTSTTDQGEPRAEFWLEAQRLWSVSVLTFRERDLKVREKHGSSGKDGLIS